MWILALIIAILMIAFVIVLTFLTLSIAGYVMQKIEELRYWEDGK